MVANRDLDDKVAYGLIRALQDNYDDYKDAAPGAVGYAFEYQDLQWVVPFHDAVVAYYEEIGVWTDELQAHQEALVERQELLLATWNDFLADAPDDEDAFEEAWMQARAEALREAGLDPVFE